MPSADPGPVVLCAGSDCSTGALDKLRRALDRAGVEAADAPCLGVCHGPVAVVAPAAREPIVLQRLRGKSARRALVDLVTGGDTSEVGGLRVRSAKRRDRAVRRTRRTLTR